MGGEEGGTQGIPAKKVTVLTGYIFVINFTMGAGVLAVPHAVVAGGWGISCIFAIVINVLALMTFFWLAEAQARCAILRTALSLDFVSPGAKTPRGPSDDEFDKKKISGLNGNGSERQSLLEDPASPITPAYPLLHHGVAMGPYETPLPSCLQAGPTYLEGPEDPAIPDHWDRLHNDELMEMGELCYVFGGNPAKHAWNAVVLIFTACILWLYAVVWSESVLLIVPVPGFTQRLECNANAVLPEHCVHGIYIIFAVLVVIMVPLVSGNWTWMHYVQKFLIFMCYLSTFAMIATSFIGIATREYKKEYAIGYTPPTDAPVAGSGDGSGTAASLSGSGAVLAPNGTLTNTTKTAPFITSLSFAKGSGFAQVFGVLILVDIGQQGVAIMMREMPLDSVRKTFTLAFTTVALWLMLLGVPVALYMGESTNALVTLNFADYNRWGVAGEIGGSIIGTIIAAYPVCSTSAAYMLNVNNMAEAIEKMFPRPFKERMSQKFCNREYHHHRMLPFQIPLRYLVILLSIGLSFVTFQFEKALSMAGLMGFLIFFFFPIGLQLKSIRDLKNLGLPTKTIYTTPIISHPATCITVAIVGLVGFVYYIDSQLIPTLMAKSS